MAKAAARMELHADAISAQTRHMDWSKGWGEVWEAYEATECDCKEYGRLREDCPDCPGVIVSTSPQCPGCDHDLSDRFQGPQMNYSYPLPRLRMGEEEAAKAIKDLPLCLVRFLEEDDDEEWALALTGGGMDLAWEICAAYVALGFIPPRQFWRLPKMAGYTLTSGRRRILSAIREGLRVERNWLRNDARDLASMRTYLAENARRGSR